MKKNPVEVIKFSPIQKEKIDYKSAKKLQMKLSKMKDLPNENVRNRIKRVDNKGTSIAVPPLQNISSEGLLPLQIANWLIYNHLDKLNYRLSLSYIQSELFMSTNPENMFSVYDILDLLGISRDSNFYRNFIMEFSMMDHKGVLYSLLRHCVKQHIMKSFSDVEVQVNTLKETKTISEKLHEIDEAFKERQKNLRETLQIQDTNKTKTKLERNDMLEILKKIEIENIKKAEQLHYQNELEHATSRIQMEFETKFQLLKEEHDQCQMEIEKKRKLEQLEIKQLKDELLKEIERLQNYEEKMNNELEKKKNQLDIEEQLISEKKNDLKVKEYEIEKRLLQITSRDDENLDISEKSRNIEKKYEKLKDLEIKIHDDSKRLKEEKIQVNKIMNEFEELKPKFFDLELSLKSLEEKYHVVLKQNHHLSEKIQSMADYATVKSELLYTKKELQNVKQHFMEILNETRQDLFNSYNKNFQQWWKEQKSIQNSSNKETVVENLWKEQQTLLEKKLENLHNKFVTRNDEQQEEIQDLKNSVQNLQVKLMQNVRTADSIPSTQTQSNATYALSKPSNVFTIPSWKKSDDTDQALPSSVQGDYHHTFKLQHSNPYRLYKSHNFDKEKSFKFISEARKRIDHLQNEAEALEKKYGEHLQANANLYLTMPSSLNSLFDTEYSSFPNIRKFNSYSHLRSYKNEYKTRHLTENIQLSSIYASSPIIIPKTSTATKIDLMQKNFKSFTLNANSSQLQSSEDKLKFIEEKDRDNRIDESIHVLTKKVSDKVLNKMKKVENEDTSTKIETKSNFVEKQESPIETEESIKDAIDVESTEKQKEMTEISKRNESSSEVVLSLKKSNEKSVQENFSQQESNRTDIKQAEVSEKIHDVSPEKTYQFSSYIIDLDAKWKETKETEEAVKEISLGSNVSQNDKKENSDVSPIHKIENDDNQFSKGSSPQHTIENIDSIKSLNADSELNKISDSKEAELPSELKSEEKEVKGMTFEIAEPASKVEMSENIDIDQNGSSKRSGDTDFPSDNSDLNISAGSADKVPGNDDSDW
ncbi:myosin-2 heavy chain-like isoform X1 [Centruroides sculpturatus]|uniref:myosin-2 heavy chain-like isoform X1 n=2 Tax=Centruroides sculpturatus TaxID=218467 RepID=UPI000C6E5284|nr:myosin-2 heavy chain-like isoform X1 [Centruroides sculpturatus]